MQTITVTYNNDVSLLGPDATHADLDAWAVNVKHEVEDRFGVHVVLLKRSGERPIDSSDDDVRRWLVDHLAGDGWLEFLVIDDEPTTERMPA